LPLTAGFGIRDDAYAEAHSSRQVLVASAKAYEHLGLPANALKENLLVDEDIDAFSSGDALHIGDTVLRLTFPCEPCSRLELVRPGLARAAFGQRGMLARVIAGGTVRPGDDIRIVKHAFAPLPGTVRQRLLHAMRAMPLDEVTSINTMLLATGAPPVYARAMTTILNALGVESPERVMTRDAMATTQLRAWDPCRYFDDVEPCASSNAPEQLAFANL
jgi:MOSC domain-containing protein YiiM